MRTPPVIRTLCSVSATEKGTKITPEILMRIPYPPHAPPPTLLDTLSCPKGVSGIDESTVHIL